MSESQYLRMTDQTVYQGQRVLIDQIVEVDDEAQANLWLKSGLAKPSTAQAYQHQQDAAADLAAERSGAPPAEPEAKLAVERSTAPDAPSQTPKGPGGK